jgi:ketosteroid isomerase-like protein
MADEQRNLEVVGRIGRLWNAGEHEGVLSLYHEDIVMTAAPDWPDPGPWIGKEQVAWNQREWASAWETIQMVTERVEAAGDKVVLIGQWNSRGAVSGAAGTFPIAIVFTLEDGLVKRFEWMQDVDEALAQAGLD